MSQDNTPLLIGGAALLYFYMRNRAAMYPPRAVLPPGAVASMPGNIGSGVQQVATGALAGFLQSLMAAPRNNTSQTSFPSSYDPMDTVRGNILNESALGNMLPDWGTDVDTSWLA
jgi:hypothetical protein